MICPICRKTNATHDAYYGFLPCDNCIKKGRSFKRPGKSIEFTTESIKQQRREYSRDITPMHNRGELNKEWLDIYGASKAKQHGFTDREIKEAKYANLDGYYKKH